MTVSAAPPWWHDVLDSADAEVLRRYRRPRADDVRWDRAALVVVDVVDSFVGPDVPVAEAQSYARTACGQAAWQALPAIGSLLDAFRSARRPVFYTVIEQVAPREEGVPRGDVVHSAVAPRPGEQVIAKRWSSAFFGTPLAPLLVEADVRTVVLAGCTTSGCVLASAIEARSRGFDVVVVPEACFDRVDALGRATLVTLDAKWARVWSLETVLGGPGLRD